MEDDGVTHDVRNYWFYGLNLPLWDCGTECTLLFTKEIEKQ